MKHNCDYEHILLEIRIEAEQIFGKAEIAENWLTKHNTVLGDSPLEVLKTKGGVHQVRKILVSIAYGGCV